EGDSDFVRAGSKSSTTSAKPAPTPTATSTSSVVGLMNSCGKCPQQTTCQRSIGRCMVRCFQALITLGGSLTTKRPRVKPANPLKIKRTNPTLCGLLVQSQKLPDCRYFPACLR